MSTVVGRYTAMVFVVDGVRLAVDAGGGVPPGDAGRCGTGILGGGRRVRRDGAGRHLAGPRARRLVETAEGATVRGHGFFQRGIVISGGRLETTVPLLGTGDFEHTP